MNESFSTGQIAKYCGVHLRTVIRWIEQGYLKGYKLPGRGNNRVLKAEFLAFLTRNQMPVPAELISREKRVLVVEDDEEMANAITRVMRRDGWHVLHARDGFQAGLALGDASINLITLDLMMPGMDGFSVLEVLASKPELSKIPVLVLSGCGDEQLQKAKTMGADAILAKPFDNQRLLAVANRLADVAGND
ncbi:response regulator [Thalassomonas actiniarum]|uniref:Response regulator n=1 Tax=Thalassomonas actiniarum TaxID=485447 RepID=A0AAF0C5I3_9GAMM|nr:response regulator [Thalassomonas actiniarum]WDE01034.1 response regulator [Thalassomonas actiniarum]